MGAPRTWRKILLILLVAAVPVAAHAQELQEQMEDLIERGFYNSAARVVGPELVESEPENAYAHYLYADALYLTGALEAARVSLDTAFELAAEPTAAMLHLRGLLLRSVERRVGNGWESGKGRGGVGGMDTRGQVR